MIILKQKNYDTDNNQSLVGMSFLKAKGQMELNRQMAQANSSPTKAGQMRPGQNSMVTPFYRQRDDSMPPSLSFDSVFESGNLALALQVSDSEYNLLLQNDINTNGHTQWFYFKVKSSFKKKTKIKFNIINLYKGKSLYQAGLRLCTLDVSKKEGEEEQQELSKWERSGTDIVYS
jgi:hypothetical protein